MENEGFSATLLDRSPTGVSMSSQITLRNYTWTFLGALVDRYPSSMDTSVESLAASNSLYKHWARLYMCIVQGEETPVIQFTNLSRETHFPALPLHFLRRISPSNNSVHPHFRLDSSHHRLMFARPRIIGKFGWVVTKCPLLHNISIP